MGGHTYPLHALCRQEIFIFVSTSGSVWVSRGDFKFSPIFSRPLKVFSRSTGKLKVQDFSSFGSKRVFTPEKSEGLTPYQRNLFSQGGAVNMSVSEGGILV